MRNKILIASSHRRPHHRHHHHLHLEATRVNANHLVSFAWRPVSCWLTTSSRLVHPRLHPPPQHWKRISIRFCFIFTEKIYNIGESQFLQFPRLFDYLAFHERNIQHFCPIFFYNFHFDNFSLIWPLHLTEKIRISWTQHFFEYPFIWQKKNIWLYQGKA